MALVRLSNALLAHFGIKVPTLSVVLMWTSGLIVLTGLTVKEIYPIWQEYAFRNIGTKIEVVTQNQTTKPPLVTFCIPFNATSLYEIVDHFQANNSQKCHRCEKLADNFLDLHKENIIFEKNDKYRSRQILSAVLIRKLLDIDQNSGNFEALSLSNSHWNQPVVEAVWDLFICVTDFDDHNELCESPLEVAWSNKSKLEKLFESFIVNLLDHTSMYEFVNHTQVRSDSSLKKLPSVVFSHQFCFKVPLSGAKFTIYVNSFRNSNFTQSWISFPSSDFPFSVSSGTKLVTPYYISASGANYMPMYTSSKIKTEGAVKTTGRSLQITYEVQSIVSRRENDPDCYEDDECMALCMVSVKINRFQCIPFTYRAYAMAENFQHLPYCNSSFTVGKNFSLQEFTTICYRRCRNPCEYVSYQWQQNENTFETPYSTFYLTISRARASSYVQFNITARQTYEQFVSAVASIFNLYLGFSGVTILALLIQAVDLLKKWLKKKTSMNVNQDAIVHDLNLDREIRQTGFVARESENNNVTLCEAKFLDNDARLERLETRFATMEIGIEEMKKVLLKVLEKN